MTSFPTRLQVFLGLRLCFTISNLSWWLMNNFVLTIFSNVFHFGSVRVLNAVIIFHGNTFNQVFLVSSSFCFWDFFYSWKRFLWGSTLSSKTVFTNQFFTFLDWINYMYTLASIKSNRFKNPQILSTLLKVGILRIMIDPGKMTQRHNIITYRETLISHPKRLNFNWYRLLSMIIGPIHFIIQKFLNVIVWSIQFYLLLCLYCLLYLVVPIVCCFLWNERRGRWRSYCWWIKFLEVLK